MEINENEEDNYSDTTLNNSPIERLKDFTSEDNENSSYSDVNSDDNWDINSVMSSDEEIDAKPELIELLEHQKNVIKYLVSKCTKQKGLLVNHYQGTGKTLLALFFLKNFPKQKKIVLCPSGLIPQWETAAEKIDLKVDRYISFEDLRKIFHENEDEEDQEDEIDYLNLIKDSIFIVDEAHNLLKIVFNNYRIDSDVLDKIKDKKEIIIRNKEQQKFMDFINMIYSCKKILLLTGTPVIDDISDIRWLINFAAGKKVVPYLENEFNAMYYKQLDKKTFSYLKTILSTFGINTDYGSEYVKRDILYYIDKNIIIADNLDVSSKLIKYIASNVISKAFDYYDSNFNYDSLDLQKVKIGGIGKYISFYKYENSPFYPTFNVINQPVLYTNSQLDLYYRLVDSFNITDQETVDLEIVDNLLQAELYKPKINDYLKGVLNMKGGIIGNLNQEPEKFKGILDIYLNGLIVDQTETIPGAFEKQTEKSTPILPRSSTVVYSNFYESGILLFANYLDKYKISYVIYEPNLSKKDQKQILQDFKNKKITMLLLHPIYYEGFSIAGVRVFNILEPIKEYFVKEQLFTRVIRYKSHFYLPVDEQNVVILQWYCTLSGITDKLRQSFNIFKTNISNINLLQNIGGIDDDTINNVDKNASFLNELANTFKSISIDANTIPEECCIYGDTSCKLMKLCMDNY